MSSYYREKIQLQIVFSLTLTTQKYFATFQSGQEKKKVLLLFIYTCRDKSVRSKLLKQKTADEPIKQHKSDLPHTETLVDSKTTDIHNNLQQEIKGNSSD